MSHSYLPLLYPGLFSPYTWESISNRPPNALVALCNKPASFISANHRQLTIQTIEEVAREQTWKRYHSKRSHPFLILCYTLSTKLNLSLMFSILIPSTSPFYFEQLCSLKQILCSGNTTVTRDCSLVLNYLPSLIQRKVRLRGSGTGIRVCNCFSSIIRSLQLLNNYGCHQF